MYLSSRNIGRSLVNGAPPKRVDRATKRVRALKTNPSDIRQAPLVILDFDGTVTAEDTGVHLLRRLARGDWQSLEKEYLAGRIGSRDCIRQMWQLLPHDQDTVEKVIAEVPIDPHTSKLINSIKAAGAEVLIVSDGFGIAVRKVASELSIAVLTNIVDWSTGEISFPHGNSACPCALCGTCKETPVRAARLEGRRVVVVGDGRSDLRAAMIADAVFAKGHLQKLCRESDIPFTPFNNFKELLEPLRKAISFSSG